MRCVAFLCAAIALALNGCTRDPFVTAEGETASGNWRISRQTDRITGKALPSVGMVALASNSYVDFPKPAMMQLSCFEKKPLVRFGFEFKLGADVNTVLGYRFDDKPGRDNIAGARFMQRHDTVVIEDPRDVAQFAADMAGAKILYVRIRSITHGRTTVEYKLDGSETALQEVFADCPLPAIAAPVTVPVATAKKRLS